MVHSAIPACCGRAGDLEAGKVGPLRSSHPQERVDFQSKDYPIEHIVLRSVLHRCTCGFTGAIRAAEELTSDLDSVTDHLTIAVLAYRSNRVNRTLEAVKGVASTRRDNFK